MNWYKTLDIHARINAKVCFELITGIKFEHLATLFTFKERMDILEFKLRSEGFDI